jgi:hypothetical protein
VEFVTTASRNSDSKIKNRANQPEGDREARGIFD